MFLLRYHFFTVRGFLTRVQISSKFWRHKIFRPKSKYRIRSTESLKKWRQIFIGLIFLRSIFHVGVLLVMLSKAPFASYVKWGKVCFRLYKCNITKYFGTPDLAFGPMVYILNCHWVMQITFTCGYCKVLMTHLQLHWVTY